MPTDFQRIIRVLLDYDVDFIVVGALSAVFQGAPVSTFDIDIVHRRSGENIDRLLNALRELNAQYRRPDDRTLTPDRDALAGDGHHLLQTDAGPLDVLGTIEDSWSYVDLLEYRVELEFEGNSVDALSLRKYIDFVEQSDRSDDHAKLAVLRETLEQSNDA